MLEKLYPVIYDRGRVGIGGLEGKYRADALERKKRTTALVVPIFTEDEGIY